MLTSGNKNFAREKKILALALSETKFLNEKNYPPPPCKLYGRSLIVCCQYGEVRQYNRPRIYLVFPPFISRMICYVLSIILSSSVGSGNVPHQTTL